MGKVILKDTEARNRYKTLSPLFERLANNIKDALGDFLKQMQIDFLDIEYRIKKFDSFNEKAQKKDCKDPFEEIDDICGIRIIHYYPSDSEKIVEKIKTEFVVKESVDNSSLLDPDRFGYRSQHLIVSIKKDWLNAPNYRGLDGLKAEIQIRTLLMHSWAAISHKLSYKKEEDVPRAFRRKLFRLSALFEVADEQFDDLREERSNYIKSLFKIDSSGKETFDDSQTLNVDSLQALLDYHCPDRIKSPATILSLLGEMRNNDITLKSLNEGFNKLKPFLHEMEKTFFTFLKEGGAEMAKSIKSEWSQVGLALTVLEITNDAYWTNM